MNTGFGDIKVSARDQDLGRALSIEKRWSNGY